MGENETEDGRLRRADVVVVGAGPVGLTLAAELAAQGVRTVVFERLRSISPRPKATTLHARAVQSLARRGRLPEVAPIHQQSETVRPFRYAGLAGLTIAAPGGEPEPLLKLRQARLERALEAQARAAGARIARGYTVRGLDQGPDAVRIEAEGPHGPLACVAGYVVGADGARGRVRALAGIGAQSWEATVCSVMALATVPHGELRPGWHRTERGWIVATAMDGQDVSLRTLSPLLGPEDGSAGGRRQSPTADEFRAEVCRIAGRDLAISRPRWLSRFTDFARLAESYRHGRVLLAGDAAHCHFPIGGQGLTTGLLDAVNLGWKLALAAGGSAPCHLLDSYDAERRPAARRVITDTRLQVAVMRPGSELAALRPLLRSRLQDEHFSRALGATISAQSTVLPARTRRPSYWEGRFLDNRPLGGTDLLTLLRPGRSLLILFGPRAGRFAAQARPWSARTDVVRVDMDPDTPYEAVLVRPDGYIAWASDGGPLTEALTEWFGPPARTASST
jgi:monooxygenase